MRPVYHCAPRPAQIDWKRAWYSIIARSARSGCGLEIPNKTIMSKRRFSRNEKIFYILSLLIVFSMVLSLIYVAITPAGF